jgi:hypothetical protein
MISVWNKVEQPKQWMESIILPVHNKGDKTDCNNYRGISFLSTSFKILSNILLSMLGPYIDEIIGDNQCGFHIILKNSYNKCIWEGILQGPAKRHPLFGEDAV